MASLTGKQIANTYKDLLQVSNSNSGIDTTLRSVSDGGGTASPLQLSNAAVNIDGTFQLSTHWPHEYIEESPMIYSSGPIRWNSNGIQLKNLV